MRCLVFSLLIILQITTILTQVCVETQMRYRDVPETYNYTYLEAYEKSFCLFWCTDTRVATAVGTRTVRKLVPEQVNVCCEGYIQDETTDNNSIHCKPYCSPSCINGYCKSPGVCTCDLGYMPDIFDPHNCSALCIKGCDHGTCTSPNTCECDQGYELINDVCEPICSDPCENGACVAPETCQCIPGYKKSEYNICEPYCSGYTAIGECIVTITCEPGWEKVFNGQMEVCEPYCSKPCENSTCVAPDTCECLHGYEKSFYEIRSLDHICQPICSGCEHGTCISPQMCVCDPGWYKMESSGTCLPHCDEKCHNGRCVAPNTCECLPGYEDKNNTGCVPVCEKCEGSCVAPNTCVCEPPEEMMLVNEEGAPCDCTENCSDEANKCERTVCVLTTTKSVAKTEQVEDLAVTTESTILSTTEVSIDLNTIDKPNTDPNELIEKVSWNNYNWVYALGSILILIIITLIAVAILKRKYLKALKEKIFNSQDGDLTTVVHYKQNNS
ncbi:protein draper-like [Helicoverpa zea]|uniref:protein draper-like n=1 Tax=Helicoverpa zea TaxID=7113 RepID=UPI001F56B715|nr:protein draper-like [Helicoverpa zea]